MNWNHWNHPGLNDEAGAGDSGGGQGASGDNVQNSTAVFGSPSSNGSHSDPMSGASQQVGQTGEGQGQGQGAGQQQPLVSLPPEQLSQIIRESMQMAAQSGGAQHGVQQQQPLTDDDLFKAFKAPAIDEAMYVSMFGLKPESPQQLAAVNKVLREYALVAARMAAAHNQQVISQVESRYAPLRQTIAQQEAERQESKFYTQYKHLDQHRDTVRMVKAQMVQDGVKFPTQDAAMKGLATATEAYLTKMGISTGANGGQGQGARPGGSGMPRTNVGGQSSHGRGGNSQPKTALEESVAIFGTKR